MGMVVLLNHYLLEASEAHKPSQTGQISDLSRLVDLHKPLHTALSEAVSFLGS